MMEAEELDLATGDVWFAYDAYAEFIRAIAVEIFRIPEKYFQEICDIYAKDTLSGEEMKEVVRKYKEIIKAKAPGRVIPDNIVDQVMMAIEAVYGSWDSAQARRYRELHRISNEWGTVAILQRSVFTNRRTTCDGKISGAGRGALRILPDGRYYLEGKFRIRGLGKDLMSRMLNYISLSKFERTAEDDISKRTLEEEYPEFYEKILLYAIGLKESFGYKPKFEFALEEGEIFFTQTGDDYETGIYAEFTDDLGGTKELSHGEGKSAGAFRGKVAYSLERAAEYLKEYDLVPPEDKKDIDGVIIMISRINQDMISMFSAENIAVCCQWSSVHAEDVARKFGIPLVYEVRKMEYDSEKMSWSIAGQEILEGSVISIDGHENRHVNHNSGKVFLGSVPLKPVSHRAEAKKFSDQVSSSPVARPSDFVLGREILSGAKDQESSSSHSGSFADRITKANDGTSSKASSPVGGGVCGRQSSPINTDNTGEIHPAIQQILSTTKDLIYIDLNSLKKGLGYRIRQASPDMKREVLLSGLNYDVKSLFDEFYYASKDYGFFEESCPQDAYDYREGEKIRDSFRVAATKEEGLIGIENIGEEINQAVKLSLSDSPQPVLINLRKLYCFIGLYKAGYECALQMLSDFVKAKDINYEDKFNELVSQYWQALEDYRNKYIHVTNKIATSDSGQYSPETERIETLEKELFFVFSLMPFGFRQDYFKRSILESQRQIGSFLEKLTGLSDMDMKEDLFKEFVWTVYLEPTTTARDCEKIRRFLSSGRYIYDALRRRGGLEEFYKVLDFVLRMGYEYEEEAYIGLLKTSPYHKEIIGSYTLANSILFGMAECCLRRARLQPSSFIYILNPDMKGVYFYIRKYYELFKRSGALKFDVDQRILDLTIDMYRRAEIGFPWFMSLRKEFHGGNVNQKIGRAHV